MGRPIAAPPGVPQDRADVLRKAFMETMADKAFLAEVAKAQFELTPVPGEKLEKPWCPRSTADPAGSRGQGRGYGEMKSQLAPYRHAARRHMDGAVFRARAGQQPERDHSRFAAALASAAGLRPRSYRSRIRRESLRRSGTARSTSPLSASPPTAPRRSTSGRSCLRSRPPIWFRPRRRLRASRTSTAPACASLSRPGARRRRI